MGEENLLWRTAQILITKGGYRIIQLSKDQRELWLEKTENKEAQIVRMLHYNLDWSNWLQRDIEVVATNSERIRKQYFRGNMTVINLYFTAHPPVDDYEHRIEEPFLSHDKGKVKVTSLVVDRTNQSEVLQKFEKLVHQPLQWQTNTLYTEAEIEQETELLKREALSEASAREKDEKAIFYSGKPFFTYILLAVQIVVFLLMEFRGGSTETATLIEFGAKFNPLILEGEWWRFLTPIFLHIGFLHLFMNSLALYYLGPTVERIYGNSRFLFIYIFAGFAGSLASFLFSPSLSAGASGAIFGCFGALLYFGVVYPRSFFRSMGLNIMVVLAINLVFGFTMPGIDNAGHIGGLLGGFVAAGIVHFPKKSRPFLQGVFLAVTATLIAGILQYGFSDSTSLVDEQSILILAQDYIQAEEYADAYRLLNEYNIQKEGSEDILFLLSFTEIKRNDLESAKGYLHQVIDLKPDFHEAQYNLALVYLEQENFAEANKYAKNAVQLEPDKHDYSDLFQKITTYLESAERE